MENMTCKLQNARDNVALRMQGVCEQHIILQQQEQEWLGIISLIIKQ